MTFKTKLIYSNYEILIPKIPVDTVNCNWLIYSMHIIYVFACIGAKFIDYQKSKLDLFTYN